MRVKCKDIDLSVEIVNFKDIEKGALKGFFTLVEHPSGRKTFDCKYFINGDNKWWSFPTKEVPSKTKEGEKDYFPYVSYMNKDYLSRLNAAVLEALKEIKTGTKNAKSEAPTRESGDVQSESPLGW